MERTEPGAIALLVVKVDNRGLLPQPVTPGAFRVVVVQVGLARVVLAVPAVPGLMA